MTVPPTSPRIIAGRYEVQGSLGSGAQGETYRVFDHFQQEIVALKLMGFNPLGQWHEASALTLLRDEHILPIQNADVASGQAYLVTELAVHGTVKDEIDTSPGGCIDPSTAVRWTRQAAQGAERAHNAGLLHTDIKPENLFLDEHRNVRLGDFGFASFMDADGRGHTSGTAQTLAPEVAQAIVAKQAKGTSRLSDVYSLGATLYWMLAGQPPFVPAPGKGIAGSAPAIVQHVPGPLRDVAPHVPLGLAQRIDKAMAREPAKRYANPGDFAAALGAHLVRGRRWHRTNEHAGHWGCWRGIKASGAVVLVCAEAAPPKYRISAVKLPHHRRIAGTSATVSQAELPSALRRTFRRPF